MPGTGCSQEPSEQEAYDQFVRELQPHDVACVHCAHPVTHAHGAYERLALWSMHRRFCPACRHTFAVQPACIAPYQRVMIRIQDLVACLIANDHTLEQVKTELEEIGVSIRIPTIRRWFARIEQQLSGILTVLVSHTLKQHPHIKLPIFKLRSIHPHVRYYYDLLALTARNSGAVNVNLWLGANYLFAPSVSVNRVSCGAAPGFSP